MLQFSSFASYPINHSVLSTATNPTASVTQVHGSDIVIVKSPTSPRPADGLITNKSGINLLIKTADCLPLFLYDPQHQVIGLIHVGWQGADKSIHTRAIQLMQANFHTRPEDIIVGMGPAICATCYTFASAPSQADQPRWQKFIFRTGQTWHVDLKGLVTSELLALGVKQIEVMPVCTYENKHFFSHRRSRDAVTPEGRNLNTISLNHGS